MREFPLYGGPSLQTAKADPGVAARAANGDHGQVLGASVQKAEEAVQGSAEAFARISDFGEMQRQEVELRRIRDESDAKFSRMLAFAPGTKESVFEKDGSIRKGKLDDLAYEFGQKIEALGGSFFHPESAMKAEAVRASVRSSLPERYWGLAAKHQLGVARQAFDTSLKLAEEKQDWGGYERSIDDAVASGTISHDEGELRLLRGRKKAELHHFENLAATNPDLAAEKINRGELDGYFSAAEQDEMMRSLRRRDDKAGYLSMKQFSSIPAKTRGKGKQEDLQEKYNELQRISKYPAQLEINQYFAQNGHFEGVRSQIHNLLYDLTERVVPGDQGPDYAECQEELIALCQFYDVPSEIKTRLLQRMDKRAAMNKDLPLLNVGDRLQRMNGIKLYRQSDYNNEVGVMHKESEAAYALYKQSAVASGQEAESKDDWMKKDKMERLASLEKNLAAQSSLEIKTQFDAWLADAAARKQGEPPNMVTQELNLQRIIRDVTGRQDLVIPRMGAAVDALVQSTLHQEKIKGYDAEKRLGKTILTKSNVEASAKDRFISPMTFSGSVSVDQESSSLPAGVLLPESMKGKVGDDTGRLAVMVPAPGNSKQGRLLPVVGFRKGNGIRITPRAASRMRITLYQRLNGNIIVHPATQAMQSYLKSEYMSESDDGVLPTDYGLLPAETAEPVSSVYTNEAGTTDALLPPL